MRTERPASTRPAARTVLLRPLQEEHAPYFPPSVHWDNVCVGGVAQEECPAKFRFLKAKWKFKIGSENSFLAHLH